MEVAVLGSSSRGNSILVRDGESSVLVDVGLPYRYLIKALSEVGVGADEIGAILLTHEHRDHISSLLRFSRHHPNVQILSSHPTLWSLGVESGVPLQPGVKKVVETFTVESFEVPHDALTPVGYRIDSDGKRLSVALDTGSVTEGLIDGLKGSNFLVVEANHNMEMLRKGPYPYHLKKRIADPLGHLSNRECGRLLRRVVGDETKGVILAHLSEKNNTPSLAIYEVVEEFLGKDVSDPYSVPGLLTMEIARPRGVVGPFKF